MFLKEDRVACFPSFVIDPDAPVWIADDVTDYV